jgi:hypothetical protein
MRFLADMCVDIRVVDWLRDSGHQALHLREHGMHRASDQAIFAKAMAEDRIGTARCWATDRLPARRVLATVIARLSTVLVEAADVLARPSVILVEDTRLRIRDLPIGGA